MSQHGQVARLQGSPAGAEPSLAELLAPDADEQPECQIEMQRRGHEGGQDQS